MSGVVAVFARNGSDVDAADVDAVLRRQAHRGPAGLRVWCNGPVGLGHAALGALGEAETTQPLVVDGGRLAIVGDLRIDNRGELIRVLEVPDHGVSDAEVVLAAYRRWGIDTPRFLEGAFAFVIWDATRQRVFCARDHLGVKPLTYHLTDGLLVGASEAEAVPCHREIPRRINEVRIADFLVSELEGVDHTSTFFEDVERLPPGHVLVVDRERCRLRRYWRPDVETELRLDSDEAYAEAFATTFREAVVSCLSGAGSPAVLLSGGIDSSAVAAVAVALADGANSPPVTTFSFIDEEWDRSPESSCIRRTVEHLGGNGVAVSPADVGRMSSAVRRGFLDCREPFDSLMVVPGLLYAMANSAGSHAVLDGVDGDIVASAASPTELLLRRGRVLRAWREAAARRRLLPGASHPLRTLVGGVLRAWAPRGLRRAVRRVRHRGDRFEVAFRESLIDLDFARRVGVVDRLEQLHSRDGDDRQVDSRVEHGCAVTGPHVAAALERYDRVAARCCVEARHPFFNLRLVELCISLPWDLKVRHGWSKFVLRLATEGKVADEVRWRHDFGDVLWRATSRVIAEERSFLGSILHEHHEALGLYVDEHKLEAVRQALHGHPTDQEEVWLWQASTLATWLERVQ